jgi:carbamate kinase
MESNKVAVVALGGNAISPGGETDTIHNQFRQTRKSLASIVELIRGGYRLVITHGNGPQVGNAMLRVEMARGKAPELPVGVCVADVAGGMGYMIEQSLQNRLHREGIDKKVTTIITQVLVDRDDPAMARPSKYVGSFYIEGEADKLCDEMSWVMGREKEVEKGWRRLVLSPLPSKVLSAGIIKLLVESGIIVITAGGGGIPVYIEEDEALEGIDGVVDKDRTSAVLGNEIGADLFIILTDVGKVALNYGTESQVDIDVMTIAQANEHLAAGQFPPGNMGPKIEAAIDFLKKGGKKVIIASIRDAYKAVEGRAGTMIVPV